MCLMASELFTMSPWGSCTNNVTREMVGDGVKSEKSRAARCGAKSVPERVRPFLCLMSLVRRHTVVSSMLGKLCSRSPDSLTVYVSCVNVFVIVYTFIPNRVGHHSSLALPCTALFVSPLALSLVKQPALCDRFTDTQHEKVLKSLGKTVFVWE